MNMGTRRSARPIGAPYDGTVTTRQAIGYIQISTDVQASAGIWLEAQQAAIEQYCALHELKLVHVIRTSCRAEKIDVRGCRMR